MAVGTLIGGPVGDRIGRKKVIWALHPRHPAVHLVLPYASLPVTIAPSVVIGLVLASAFSAIVVYAQSLMPDRIGMVSGIFFGLSFGMGGLGAALLGWLADWTSVEHVLQGLLVPPIDGPACRTPAGCESPAKMTAPQLGLTIRAAPHNSFSANSRKPSGTERVGSSATEL